ncbi:hypothetical protein CXG81DRAFT_19557 [Caulochytrium protostelioides]|uniref:Uncharacterized protein n=1 Tax=Caulochytrium protostelioides TaxID=1555241 RepID=A0A4P9X5R6_9FUNG|nr:hypothetical protein CXG81DRAFT_19557 [Caulochytrium protostelioides]|eukprot:RKP00484.1 hypothetical protein CXG81DRAFT_19557 [Caulochytrium protostelioides]
MRISRVETGSGLGDARGAPTPAVSAATSPWPPSAFTSPRLAFAAFATADDAGAADHADGADRLDSHRARPSTSARGTPAAPFALALALLIPGASAIPTPADTSADGAAAGPAAAPGTGDAAPSVPGAPSTGAAASSSTPSSDGSPSVTDSSSINSLASTTHDALASSTTNHAVPSSVAASTTSSTAAVPAAEASPPPSGVHAGVKVAAIGAGDNGVAQPSAALINTLPDSDATITHSAQVPASTAGLTGNASGHANSNANSNNNANGNSNANGNANSNTRGNGGVTSSVLGNGATTLSVTMPAWSSQPPTQPTSTAPAFAQVSAEPVLPAGETVGAQVIQQPAGANMQADGDIKNASADPVLAAPAAAAAAAGPVGDPSATLSTAAASQTDHPDSASSGASKGGAKVASIVGSTVGVAVVCALCVVGAVVYRRRRAGRPAAAPKTAKASSPRDADGAGGAEIAHSAAADPDAADPAAMTPGEARAAAGGRADARAATASPAAASAPPSSMPLGLPGPLPGHAQLQLHLPGQPLYGPGPGSAGTNRPGDAFVDVAAKPSYAQAVKSHGRPMPPLASVAGGGLLLELPPMASDATVRIDRELSVFSQEGRGSYAPTTRAGGPHGDADNDDAHPLRLPRTANGGGGGHVLAEPARGMRPMTQYTTISTGSAFSGPMAHELDDVDLDGHESPAAREARRARASVATTVMGPRGAPASETDEDDTADDDVATGAASDSAVRAPPNRASVSYSLHQKLMQGCLENSADDGGSVAYAYGYQDSRASMISSVAGDDADAYTYFEGD